MSYALQQASSSYRVEVSGWDSTQSFFLEKGSLHWNAAGQQVSLRARLCEGTVIFVRLSHSPESEKNFPVPYVVSKNLPVEIDSRVTVSITRLHPMPSYRQPIATIPIPHANCA